MWDINCGLLLEKSKLDIPETVIDRHRVRKIFFLFSKLYPTQNPTTP
jgi:hypothetical protein